MTFIRTQRFFFAIFALISCHPVNLPLFAQARELTTGSNLCNVTVGPGNGCSAEACVNAIDDKINNCKASWNETCAALACGADRSERIQNLCRNFCEGISESPSPSAVPSAAPSTKPSASPSTKPSASPSAKPSLSPSASPSAKPSLSPSASPSAKPSASPSASPSAKPSSSPTTGSCNKNDFACQWNNQLGVTSYSICVKHNNDNDGFHYQNECVLANMLGEARPGDDSPKTGRLIVNCGCCDPDLDDASMINGRCFTDAVCAPGDENWNTPCERPPSLKLKACLNGRDVCVDPYMAEPGTTCGPCSIRKLRGETTVEAW